MPAHVGSLAVGCCYSLAAQFAGASAEVVTLYAAFGRALGTVGQLASDCHDLFLAAQSCDLANGTRTLPIAFHLERLAGAERAQFLALLEQARTDAGAREAVRRGLRAAGALRHCAVVVEIYCQRALRVLELARPWELASRGLREMVHGTSFFPKGGVQ